MATLLASGETDSLALGLHAAVAVGAAHVELSCPDWGLTLSTNEVAMPTPEVQVVLRGISTVNAVSLARSPLELASGGLGIAAIASAVGFLPLPLAVLASVVVASSLAKTGFDFLRDAPGRLSAEAQRVRLACVYAPIPVSINGRPVNRSICGPSQLCVAPARVRALTDAGWVPCPQLGARELPHLRIDGESLWGHLAVLTLAHRGKHDYAASRVMWVKDGAVVETQTRSSWPSGYTVVVCAHNLSTDLSSLRLVRDDAYEALDARLGAWVAEAESAFRPRRGLSLF